MMTLDDFVREVKERGLWFNPTPPFRGNGCLWWRTREGRCPVTALCYEMTGGEYANSNFLGAAEALGLDEEAMRLIVMAADNIVMQPDVVAVRERLFGARKEVIV